MYKESDLLKRVSKEQKEECPLFWNIFSLASLRTFINLYNK